MRLSAGLISVAAWTLHAAGHGAMQFPQARNVFSSHFCPQCANGPSVCGSGGDSQWQADDSGATRLNGDYTTPLTHLYAGGLVEVEVFITAAHLGHFAVELCANPGSKITEDCFVKLERDPTDTRFSPYIDSSPWAAPFPDNSCATTFTQRSPMKVRFKVPNVVSDHAVIRWYWQTGNSCAALPETTSGKTPSSVTKWSATINGRKCSVKTSSASSCGSKCPHAGCANEQFKNCADVKILAASGSNEVVTSSNYQTSAAEGGSGGNEGNGGNNGGDNGGEESNGGGGNNGGSDSEEVAECKAKVHSTNPDWHQHCLEQCDWYHQNVAYCGGLTPLANCVKTKLSYC